MESIRCWAPGHPSLVEIRELSHAVKLLENYRSQDETQQQERCRILAFCAEHPDALCRTCTTGHLTASSIIVDHSRSRVLLHRHAKLDSWLQLGGHCDGDGNFPHVAWREAVEESGIPDLVIDPEIIDLDVHVIPRLETEPQHLHLDVRFEVVAPENCVPCASEESTALSWYALEELDQIDTDDSVLRLVRLALNDEGGHAA